MPGKRITEPCCICGKTKDESRLGRLEGKVYCQAHLHQMIRHGHILPIEKTRNRLKTCCVCGMPAKATFGVDGKEYCRKHYMQMYHHGHILSRTIYDKNEYIDHLEEGYTECITYNKDFNKSYHVMIDLDCKSLIEQYKVYTRQAGSKIYAMLTLKNGKKQFLHRFILGINKKYVIDETVDHINGNSLDNRLCNLRICSQAENAKNNRGNRNTIVGVSWLKYNKKWTARIMSNYRHYHLGNFDTYEEAVLARLIKEKELCGDFGPNKNLFYLIDHPLPIENLKKVLSEGV